MVATLVACILAVGPGATSAMADTPEPAGGSPDPGEMGTRPDFAGQNVDDRMQPPGPSKVDMWQEDITGEIMDASGSMAGNAVGDTNAMGDTEGLEGLEWWSLGPPAQADPDCCTPTPEPTSGPEPTSTPNPAPSPSPSILGDCGKIIQCGGSAHDTALDDTVLEVDEATQPRTTQGNVQL